MIRALLQTVAVTMVLLSGSCLAVFDYRAFVNAAKIGDIVTIQAMVAEASQSDKHNALMWAAGNNQIEVVRFFLGEEVNGHRLPLNKIANIHADRDEALRVAAANNCLESAYLLLQHGAALDVIYDFCSSHPSSWERHILERLESIIQYCLHQSDRAVVESLMATMPIGTKNRLLQWAAGNNQLEIMRFLLGEEVNGHQLPPDKIADIHANRGAALRAAAINHCLESVYFLMTHGADLGVLSQEQQQEIRAYFPDVMPLVMRQITALLLMTDNEQELPDRHLLLARAVHRRLLQLHHEERIMITDERVTEIVDEVTQEDFEQSKAKQQAAIAAMRSALQPVPTSSRLVDAGLYQPYLMTKDSFNNWVINERNTRGPVIRTILLNAKALPVEDYVGFISNYMQPQYTAEGEFTGFAKPLRALPMYMVADATGESYLITAKQARELVALWLIGYQEIVDTDSYWAVMRERILRTALVPESDSANPLYQTVELRDAVLALSC